MLKHWASHASSKYVDKQISKQVRRAAKPFITSVVPRSCPR